MERIRRPDGKRDEEVVCPPPAAAPESSPLEELVSAVGNRAFAASVSPVAHPQLDPATPAWTQDGEMVLGPPAFLLSTAERADVVRHETVHVLQQRTAPVEESGAARERAERIAESGAPSAAELRSPAPSLLAAPVTGKPAAGFDRLFAGHGEIVGEVADSGVTVRARRSYSELGIEAPVSSNGGFATSSMTDLQYLSCGNHAFPALQALGKKLHDVAKAVARVNGVIAAGSPWRVESVFAVSEASRLHFADGKALITLAPEDLENAAVETVMHEASHAVFESHSHPDAKHPEALAPDTFALRFADLYLRLASTRPVVVPAKPFRKQRPAFEARGEHAREPAGHVMVTDGLWSGGAKTDGHPWDGPDEFFASAFGAFVHDEKLLGEIIAHYGTADGAIPAAGAELLAMLRALKDPKALASMRGLTTAAESQAATAAIKARESGSTTIKDRLGSVLDPAKIEPAIVNCPAPAKKP